MEADSEELCVKVPLSGSGRYILSLVPNQGWKTHCSHLCPAVFSLLMKSSFSGGFQLLSPNMECLLGFCPRVFSHSVHSFIASIIFYVVIVLKSQLSLWAVVPPGLQTQFSLYQIDQSAWMSYRHLTPDMSRSELSTLLPSNRLFFQIPCVYRKYQLSFKYSKPVPWHLSQLFL